MNSTRLTLKALNESRRVDPLAYLSLRYTMASVIANRDAWARTIAPEIVRRRTEAMFLNSKQFKQFSEDSVPEYRDVCRPGGPEALAEIALLEACGNSGSSFQSSRSVFSYRFASRSSSDGIFVPYFELFSERQNKISEVCKRNPKDWVLYADIKRFYPSITSGRARKAWDVACEDSELGLEWKEFGRILLTRQYSHGKGLLIGPLFSHLIANLVLRELDCDLEKSFAGRYFRYVDDFAIVVPPRKKTDAIKLLRKNLKKIGLRLNSKKTHWIGASKWRENAPYQRNEYDDIKSGDEEWMHFIDKIKCYLMENPDKVDEVKSLFQKVELRVPLPRYSVEVKDRHYRERFIKRTESQLFKEALSDLDSNILVGLALQLRDSYSKKFHVAWQDYRASVGPIKKWKLSSLRYILGRMLIVGSMAQIKLIRDYINSELDVAEYCALYNVVITRNAAPLLRFGWKVAASAGQVLAAGSISVECRSYGWKDEHIQAYCTLLLSGVKVVSNIPKRIKNDYRIKVVSGGLVDYEWVEMEDSFFRELFALFGKKTLEDHLQLLQTPADPDEKWEMFADELLGVDPT